MLVHSGFSVAIITMIWLESNAEEIFHGIPNLGLLQENYNNTNLRKTVLSFIENWIGEVHVNTTKERKLLSNNLQIGTTQSFYARAKERPTHQNFKIRHRDRTKPIRDFARTRKTPRITPAILRQQEYQNTTETLPATLSETRNFFANYDVLTPYALVDKLKQIIPKFPEANITIHTLGKTTEYNEIVLLKIRDKVSEQTTYFRTGKYVDEAPEKKIVLIVHGLSVMGMNVKTINDLMESCLINTKDVELLMSFYLSHLDKFEIFLIPLANPDGVVVNSNYWNKNVSPQSACSGVALDRNFDVAWNGSLLSSCSQSYPGPAPFSEPETRAIRDLFHHYSHKIIAYIHVHHGTYTHNSFKGDAVLYPKGFTEVTNDDDKYVDLRAEIDEAMKNASFQMYSVAVETLNSWYGTVTGTSVDYATTVYGIPFALEFVMQTYSVNLQVQPEAQVTYHVLNEIWRRVIDVVFNSIHQSQQPDDNQL